MQRAQMNTHQLQTMAGPNAEETHEYSLFYTQGQNTSALILVTLKVNGIDQEMVLGTGATLSVIIEQTYVSQIVFYRKGTHSEKCYNTINNLYWGCH